MPGVIIYIGGFLTNEELPHWFGRAPKDFRIISVCPSGVASIHDRVMQVFYELKGGLVQFGKEHSDFHSHNEFGQYFERGLYEEWDEQHPVYLMGHSFGGLTALALHTYLSEKNRFSGGHETSDKWVKGICVINSPLCGCLTVYSLGMNLVNPPIVRPLSGGGIVGLLSNLFEYFDSKKLKSMYDFKLGE